MKNQSAVMNEQIEKVIKSIPLFTLIVYIIGYIVYNVYLNRFGFVDNQVLNFQYLVVGIISVACLLPSFIGLICIHVFDNVEFSNGLYVNPLAVSLIITNCLSLIFIVIVFELNVVYQVLGFEIAISGIYIAYAIAVSLITVLIFAFTKRKYLIDNRLDGIIKDVSAISATIIVLIVVLNKDTRFLIALFIINNAIIMFLSFNFFKNINLKGKNIDILNSKFFIVPFFILIASYSWGLNVYGEIPQYYGGGKTTYSSLIIKNSEDENVKRITDLEIKNNQIDSIKIIHQNSNNYFIQTKDSVNMTLSKSLFIALK